LYHFLPFLDGSHSSIPNMATFLTPDEKPVVQYDETLGDKDESPARRFSVVAEINHSEVPVWEQRETYGKSGTLDPIEPVCFFSNILARLHGYLYLEICFSMCCLRNNGRTPVWLRVSR
jgi:hypothetical protein